jgi:ubiquinone/menaquinone biosynthesis C-methylase UbiE
MAPPSERSSDASRLLALVSDSWKCQAVHVAARLGIADLLADGPRSAEELAGATGAHTPSLRRLLRALATIELVREREDGSFETTPMGALLRADSPDSLRSWALHWAAAWPVWERLLDSVMTGRSVRSLVGGTDGFEHLERDPAAGETFHRAMVELTRLVARDFVRTVDWSATRKIVDVGGGSGELLVASLTACPGAVGVLYDTAAAIELGREHVRAAGLEHRCELVAGDFFSWVPRGADTYILKSVLHDWDDDRAARILAACRRAASPGSRLLVVERIMPDRLGSGRDDQGVACSDLHMLIQLGARERTEAELRALLSEAGFDVGRVAPLRSTLAVLEATPRSGADA